MEFVKEYWWVILLGIVGFFFVVGLIRALFKKRKKDSVLVVDAILETGDVALEVGEIAVEVAGEVEEAAAEVVGEVVGGL